MEAGRSQLVFEDRNTNHAVLSILYSVEPARSHNLSFLLFALLMLYTEPEPVAKPASFEH
jgi:hypothetical protein